MMASFDYKDQNALRQAIVFSFFFFCEESLVRDTNLQNKDCSECILVVVVKWHHDVAKLKNSWIHWANTVSKYFRLFLSPRISDEPAVYWTEF